eukprot:gene5646-8611_t
MPSPRGGGALPLLAEVLAFASLAAAPAHASSAGAAVTTCPSNYDVFEMSADGSCPEGLGPLLARKRCLPAAVQLQLPLATQAIQLYSDKKHPRGCFFDVSVQQLGWNDAGDETTPPTAGSYRAICTGGVRVRTWGDPAAGGDSATVADSLSGVQSVFGNEAAFAALKLDGSVVAWGSEQNGGRMMAGGIPEAVQDVAASSNAFAALSVTGKVYTWGSGAGGGNSSTVAAKLASGVASVFANPGAFAALKATGEVVAWGDGATGGNSATVAAFLSRDIARVFANPNFFVALHMNGSAASWGSSAVPNPLIRVDHVSDIAMTDTAVAALRIDGSVVTWGDLGYGGNSTSVAEELSGSVVSVAGTSQAFAALKEDGSVVTWGKRSAGGESTSVAALLQGVAGVGANQNSFFALKKSLKGGYAVVAWGGFNGGCCGGNSTSVAGLISSDVAAVYASQDMFAAELRTGRLVSWGSATGINASNAHQFSAGMARVCPSQTAFAAIKANGSALAWGTGPAAVLAIEGLALGYVDGVAALLASTQQAFAIGVVPPVVPPLPFIAGWATATAAAVGFVVVGIA